MSEEDQDEVMYGDGPNFTYDYLSNFMGLPLTNSSFKVYIKALRPSQNPISYNRQPAKF